MERTSTWHSKLCPKKQSSLLGFKIEPGKDLFNLIQVFIWQKRRLNQTCLDQHGTTKMPDARSLWILSITRDKKASAKGGSQKQRRPDQCWVNASHPYELKLLNLVKNFLQTALWSAAKTSTTQGPNDSQICLKVSGSREKSFNYFAQAVSIR